MGGRMHSAARTALLRLRVHPLAREHATDPYSPEYLYLVQQSKRLSLAASIARLRPRNILAFPVMLPVVAVKTLDLWIANQIIRSLINERDLMEQTLRADKFDP